MAPVEVSVGQDYESLWSDIKANGYLRVRIDGETHSVESRRASIGDASTGWR